MSTWAGWVALGQKVAICDQVEDPAEANGIVRREVTETVTPGTVLHDALLTAGRNNFLVALTEPTDERLGLAALDLSTGELSVQDVLVSELRAELGSARSVRTVVAARIRTRGKWPKPLG